MSLSSVVDISDERFTVLIRPRRVQEKVKLQYVSSVLSRWKIDRLILDGWDKIINVCLLEV